MAGSRARRLTRVNRLIDRLLTPQVAAADVEETARRDLDPIDGLARVAGSGAAARLDAAAVARRSSTALHRLRSGCRGGSRRPCGSSTMRTRRNSAKRGQTPLRFDERVFAKRLPSDQADLSAHQVRTRPTLPLTSTRSMSVRGPSVIDPAEVDVRAVRRHRRLHVDPHVLEPVVPIVALDGFAVGIELRAIERAPWLQRESPRSGWRRPPCALDVDGPDRRLFAFTDDEPDAHRPNGSPPAAASAATAISGLTTRERSHARDITR